MTNTPTWSSKGTLCSEHEKRYLGSIEVCGTITDGGVVRYFRVAKRTDASHWQVDVVVPERCHLMRFKTKTAAREFVANYRPEYDAVDGFRNTPYYYDNFGGGNGGWLGRSNNAWLEAAHQALILDHGQLRPDYQTRCAEGTKANLERLSSQIEQLTVGMNVVAAAAQQQGLPGARIAEDLRRYIADLHRVLDNGPLTLADAASVDTVSTVS